MGYYHDGEIYSEYAWDKRLFPEEKNISGLRNERENTPRKEAGYFSVYQVKRVSSRKKRCYN